VLMAADIIAFDVDVVPVGKDQVQHVEIARDIAQRIISAYGPPRRMAQTSRRRPAARRSSPRNGAAIARALAAPCCSRFSIAAGSAINDW